jgi:hypothetical protein
MKAIRIRMVPHLNPIRWQAWPEGREDDIVEADSLDEAVGRLVRLHGRLLDVEVLGQRTPVGQTPVR